MEIWVTTKLAFGIDLGAGIPDIFYLTEDRDEEYETWDGDICNFEAAWLKSKGEGFDFPFDFVVYHAYDERYARYFLAYNPSIQIGGSDQPLYFQTPEMDVAKIKQMIEDYGFGQDVTPVWAVLSLYG